MQRTIFETEGQRLADVGLSLAIETADAEFPNWSERCWQLFVLWLKKKPEGYEFMIEEFRTDAYKWNKIERPKSDRSFGFLSKRALKKRMIDFVGNRKVNNVKAHSCFASIWRKK